MSRAALITAIEALKPFSDCTDQLEGDPDDEWAKFRLLVSDYRRAFAAYNMLNELLAQVEDEA